MEIPSLDQARAMFSEEDIAAERQLIDQQFRSLKFSDRIRQTVIACQKKCNGEVEFPFNIHAEEFLGKNEVCFGDCLNINFEKGPWLRTLGEVPEDAVPKKFIWGHEVSDQPVDQE